MIFSSRFSFLEGYSSFLIYFYIFVEMKEPPYWANYNKTRMFTHKICSSKYFDLVIAAVIGLNVITMAMEFYMMPDVSK